MLLSEMVLVENETKRWRTENENIVKFEKLLKCKQYVVATPSFRSTQLEHTENLYILNVFSRLVSSRKPSANGTLININS